MGSTFSAPLKKKITRFCSIWSRAIPYVGASLVVRRSAAIQEAKTVKRCGATIDSLRFFQKPENKPVVMQTMAKHLRLSRVEDAETGYNAMAGAYSSDLRPKPEGLKRSIPS
jgi:hypothetical protein